jgi:SAM-dependent methyltransferase
MEDYQATERVGRDIAAPTYDEWYRETKGWCFDAYERDLFRLRVRPGERVLDLGSGTGRISESVSTVADVVALDFSTTSLGVLAGKGMRSVAPVGGDCTRLPFAPASFDVVVSCQVLQHLRPAQLAEALRECWRVLAPGGRLVASLYNVECWRAHGVAESDTVGGLYMRRFARDEFEALGRQAGFENMELRYYKALPDGGRVPKALTKPFASADRACNAISGVGRRLALYQLVTIKAIGRGRRAA